MKKIITFIILTIFLFIPKVVFASTGQYYIDKLNIDAQILSNGDVEVNEIIKYRFDGSFNGIYRDLKSNGAEGYIINGVSVTDDSGSISEAKEGYSAENNTYEINTTGDTTQVKLYCKSNNESKSFNFKYTIKGAAKKYSDVARLNWNFYSVENIDSVKEGTLTVSLKDQKFEDNSYNYTVFGDGNINSENIEDGIKINFTKLTSIIGIDLTFKPEYLSMAIESVENNKSSTENNGYVKENNRYTPQSNNENKDIGGDIGLMIVVLIGVIGGVVLYNNSKFNKALEKYRAEGNLLIEEYRIDPPSELPPALVNLLINEKFIIDDMLNTTLFYLVNKGYYTVEEKIIERRRGRKILEENDLIFTRTSKYFEIYYKHLNYLVDWFDTYSINGSFSLNGIKDLMGSKKRAQEFLENLNEFKTYVKDDGEEAGFYTFVRNKKVLENKWYGEKSMWLSYKKYLKTYSHINYSKLSDLSLIYSSALELDEDSVKSILNTLSDKAKNNSKSYGYTNYWLYNNYFYYSLLFNHINRDATNKVNPSTNNSHFNNTGGFSGGGGFTGGGGGGSGAF